MANKTVDMSKLKQVLRLYKNGDMSNRGIAEALDLDKNTVNKLTPSLPTAWWEVTRPIRTAALTS